MKDSEITSDYRESHLGENKPESYRRSFSENSYKRMVWSYEQRVLSQIVEAKFQDREFRHLDFACGTGRILTYLQKYRAVSSVGVDISPGMLELAKESAADAECYQGDLTQEDILGERQFDLITAFRFFPNANAELRQSAMKALARHLDKNGTLVFNNHKNLAFPANRLKRVIGRGFDRGMTKVDAESLVNSVELKVVELFHFGVWPSMNSNLLLPSGLLQHAERWMSSRASLSRFAMNQIFVCQRSLE